MDEIKIKIKPLSVNRAWQGKRFKTQEYSNYERLLLCLLPAGRFPEPPYRMYYEYGLSNPLSDYDNPTKPTQDILAKKYGFNDKDIYEAFIRKRIVKRGEEYIRVKVEHIEVEGYGNKKCKRSVKQTESERTPETVSTNSRVSRKR